MKTILTQLYCLLILFSIIISCQTKEEKQFVNNNSKTIIAENPIVGKWFLVSKKNNTYTYCADSDRFFEINTTQILDHTPMEDSDFKIDHYKTVGGSTYFYITKNESSYYILKWVDKNKGIISYQFNKYDPILFINEKKKSIIENKKCQSTAKSCEFAHVSDQYKFTLEAAEYANVKEQKNPISAWIIITNKSDSKSQEIHYEPNSWVTYSNLPCGNFVVKDFNFDRLEDFAIVWDDGGNGGALYEYYFQDRNGKFSTLDSFPLQYGSLAGDLDFKNKTIITKNPVGCCNLNINTYKLNYDNTWEVNNRREKMMNQ